MATSSPPARSFWTKARGQRCKGHATTELTGHQSKENETELVHEPGPCTGCGSSLEGRAITSVQKASTVRLPPTKVEVTEHHLVDRECVCLTRTTTPARTGLSHWSSRELARYLKQAEGVDVSHNFIADLSRENHLQPHRTGTFKVPMSSDPNFEAKVFNVVGLYLSPPEGAIVLSFDEKTQCQAFQRTQPLLPIDFGRTGKRTHDYVRHGTTNLFAAWRCTPARSMPIASPTSYQRVFVLYGQVSATYPAKQELHVIMDNLSTRSGPDVNAWLVDHPNVTPHYTQTGNSWMNTVEIWLGIITRHAIRRDTFTSLRHLILKIEDYAAHWNADAKLFEWTATAEEILEKVAILQREYRKLLANNSK